MAYVLIPAYAKYLIAKGELDFDGDSFKMALVDTLPIDNIGTSTAAIKAGNLTWGSFAGTTYDVSQDEVASGSGYTTGGGSATCSVSYSDLPMHSYAATSQVDWSFSGAVIVHGAILYDNTHAKKPVIAVIGIGSQTAPIQSGAGDSVSFSSGKSLSIFSVTISF